MAQFATWKRYWRISTEASADVNPKLALALDRRKALQDSVSKARQVSGERLKYLGRR